MTPVDQREPGNEPLLVEAIRAAIEAAPDRRITFARYMELALTEPGLGYYATGDSRPARHGDFLTAPELHPFFGRAVGRLLDQMWEHVDGPERYVLREYGAGRGTLAASITEGLRMDGSGLAHALEHQPVDLGTPLRADPVVGCILANEFLDALPVHRVIQRADGLREVQVTWRDDRFTDIETEPSTGALASHLEADGVVLVDGQRAEVGLAAHGWMRRAAEELERGHVLVIDYGHEAVELYGPRRMAGTLLGYRQHTVVDDPYSAIGRTDLTAHVDVTALKRTAAECGLEAAGEIDQAHLLVALGLGEMLDRLGRDPATQAAEYLLARSSVARLLDPRQLGAFRVMAWSKGIDAGMALRGLA